MNEPYQFENIHPMSKTLADSVSSTPIRRLVTELEEINKFKLRDSDIVNCIELYAYYVNRQSAIIDYLNEMLALDSVR